MAYASSYLISLSRYAYVHERSFAYILLTFALFAL
jgi:hypothetical protein